MTEREEVLEARRAFEELKKAEGAWISGQALDDLLDEALGPRVDTVKETNK
jgi:hypothetical protein